MVETISGGRLAVDCDQFVGCGYSSNGIQRVSWQGRNYILILPVEVDAPRSRSHCRACDRVIKSTWSYCSMSCRANHVQGGRLRHVALHFAALAAQGQFGPPMQLRDRFCTICRLAFCSLSCPSHPPHGHPTLYPPAGPDNIKTIVNVDGWAAIPQGQLPFHLVQDVQEVHGPDGMIAYPIHRREHPVPPFLGHPCHGAGCHETFFGAHNFCSLRCCHHL